jgi:hypothetical protein
MEEQPFSTLIRGAESNPARVLWREVARLKNIYFQMFKSQRIFAEYRNRCFSSPNQFGIELKGIQATVRLVLPVRNDH